MGLAGVNRQDAERLLEQSGGFVREAVRQGRDAGRR
jgi:N-acetylmuramic acid 6-phosphate (MurNAc-6-P) etherase